MVKNGVAKQEQKNIVSSAEENAPLILDALDDVLITDIQNNTKNEAALPNPFQVSAQESASSEQLSQSEELGFSSEPIALTPESIQSPEIPENALKQEGEQPQELQQEATASEQQPLPSRRGSANAQQQPVVEKSEARHEIESVLADGLVDVYKTMTPQEQVAFRQKGEEVAIAIEQMMTQFRATTKKVITLIREWLRMIPRVNRFFLEQESKIKTDDIIKLQRELKKKKRNHIEIQ